MVLPQFHVSGVVEGIDGKLKERRATFSGYAIPFSDTGTVDFTLNNRLVRKNFLGAQLSVLPFTLYVVLFKKAVLHIHRRIVSTNQTVVQRF
jgi:hypothetical protein